MKELLQRLFGTQKKENRFRPQLEELGQRITPSTVVTVNSINDNPGGPIQGQTTLRDAINSCNANGGGTINFNFVGIINIQAALPPILTNITIQGNGLNAQKEPNIGIQGVATGFSGFTVPTGATFELNQIWIANFTANTTPGGGIDCSEGNLILNQDYISTNTTNAGGGGGIYCGPNSQLTIAGSDIALNTAAQAGGGIYFNGSRSDMYATEIEGNEISGAAGQGGGIYYAGGSNIMHTGCAVTNNDNNGGVNSAGGGLYIASGSLTLEDTQVNDNETTGNGGGIYNQDGTLICEIDANGWQTSLNSNTALMGGGLYLQQGSTTIFDGCNIQNNILLPGGSGKGYYKEVGAVVNIIELTNKDGTN